MHWSRVSADIGYDDEGAGAGRRSRRHRRRQRRRAALDSYEPQTPGYLALKAKLAEIRAGKADAAKPPIANGPVLEGRHAGRPRAGTCASGSAFLGDGGTTYDKALAEAVKKFQQEHELKPTGTLTAATVEALNGRSPITPTDIILANMERWRWMPHDLGKTYVIVNLPDYTLRVMHDGKQVWTDQDRRSASRTCRRRS